jgi:hypothetical protein
MEWQIETFIVQRVDTLGRCPWASRGPRRVQIAGVKGSIGLIPRGLAEAVWVGRVGGGSGGMRRNNPDVERRSGATSATASAPHAAKKQSIGKGSPVVSNGARNAAKG